MVSLKAKILEYGITRDQARLQWLNDFYDELGKTVKFENIRIEDLIDEYEKI